LTSEKLEFDQVLVTKCLLDSDKPLFRNEFTPSQWEFYYTDVTLTQTPVDPRLAIEYDDAFAKVLQNLFIDANRYHAEWYAYGPTTGPWYPHIDEDRNHFDPKNTPTKQQVENWTQEYIMLASHYAAELLDPKYFRHRAVPFDQLTTTEQAEALFPIGFQYAGFNHVLDGIGCNDIVARTNIIAAEYDHDFFVPTKDRQNREKRFIDANSVMPPLDQALLPVAIGDMIAWTDDIDRAMAYVDKLLKEHAIPTVQDPWTAFKESVVCGKDPLLSLDSCEIPMYVTSLLEDNVFFVQDFTTVPLY